MQKYFTVFIGLSQSWLRGSTLLFYSVTELPVEKPPHRPAPQLTAHLQKTRETSPSSPTPLSVPCAKSGPTLWYLSSSSLKIVIGVKLPGKSQLPPLSSDSSEQQTARLRVVLGCSSVVLLREAG
jgi:hypothetical protein